MKKIILTITLLLGAITIYAQELEQLKAEQAAKKDSIKALEKEVNNIQEIIDGLPGWRVKAFGTIGGNIAGSNNWYSYDIPNSATGNFGFSINAIAHLEEAKYFWKNEGNLKISWVKLDNKDDSNDSDKYAASTDVFDISSLYGYKLAKKFAVSALGEYRTSLLNNFNDPGYLDLGVGGTWTPAKGLVVVVHPFNYNFVFSKNDDNIYKSSFGAKIVADYMRDFGDVQFKTKLSTFLSYKTMDYSNWTWTNTFGYTLWGKFGVGLEFALRQSKQEALDYNRNILGDANATFDNIDNKLQNYWLIGLNYSI
jgi:hypothetical protein